MNALTETVGQTPEAEARLFVMAMELEAVTMVGCSNKCGAVVQNWIGDVFVVLTMVDLRCAVWMVGIPTQGISLTVSDDVETVVAMIAGYIAESEVIEAVAVLS